LGAFGTKLNMEMKKLVSITPYATFPPKMGGQVLIDAMNREFPALGWKIDQFSMGIRKPDLKSIGRTKKLESIPRYTEWRRTEPVTVAVFSVFSSQQLGFLNAGELLKKRRWTELEERLSSAQAILYESPWGYEPGALPIPEGVPLVFMSQNAEFKFIEMYRKQRKPFVNYIAKLIEHKEFQILRDADVVATITAQDAEVLSNKYGISRSKMYVVPRGINLDRFPVLFGQEKQVLRDALGIGDQIVGLFVGSAHGPNLIAAQSLIKMSEKILDNVLIIVVGTVAKYFKGQNKENLWFVPVEVPQPYLQIADMALNPVTTGSGLNIKMLEYFGLELPCVTTTFGARGIEGQPGEDLIIAELDEFPHVINLLAQNPELRNRIGKNGRLLAEKKYSARVTAQTILKLIEDWKHDYAESSSG